MLFFTLIAASGSYAVRPDVFALNFGFAVPAVSIVTLIAIRFGLLATTWPQHHL